MKIVALVLCCASLSWGVKCPKGYIEDNGHCYPDIRPETGPSVKPSDEKPPRDKMPSYQRGGIKLVDAPSTKGADEKADEERHDADAKGQAACESKYGKGQCGPLDSAKLPK